MLSATLDSNTYISALNFGGTPLEVLNLARAGFIRLDVSEAILEEFAGVRRDKFRWREDDIAARCRWAYLMESSAPRAARLAPGRT